MKNPSLRLQFSITKFLHLTVLHDNVYFPYEKSYVANYKISATQTIFKSFYKATMNVKQPKAATEKLKQIVAFLNERKTAIVHPFETVESRERFYHRKGKLNQSVGYLSCLQCFETAKISRFAGKHKPTQIKVYKTYQWPFAERYRILY